MAFGKLGMDRNGDNEDLAEINMIPLVDVMLVLLIIFMVAAPLSISGIRVDLPTSRAKGVNVDEQRVILTIDKSGKYFIDKLAIASDELAPKLKAIFLNRERKELYIRADAKVPYGKVIDAMSTAKLIGVQKLAMLTTPPNAPKP